MTNIPSVSSPAEVVIEIPVAQTGNIAVFNGPGIPLEIHSFHVPPIQSGEILVENVYTTLCGSDLHTCCGLRNEPVPTVLGHEIVGRILEIAKDHPALDLFGRALAPGSLITWTVFASDPTSANSLKDMPQKGDGLFKYGHARVTGTEVFHGGLGDYCILKTNTGIIRLPDNLPVDIAATLNCSVSTVAAALRMAGDIAGKSIFITGMGHLGLTCAAMCREAGAKTILAADISEKRLGQAIEFGADHTINVNGNAIEFPGLISDKTNGQGIDHFFDMSGSADAMEKGVGSLGIGGTAILVGAVFHNRPLQLDAELVIRKLLTIKGIHNYNFTDFKKAFEFLENNWQKYPFGSVVEKEFSLAEVNQAFEFAIGQRPLRVGVRFSQPSKMKQDG